MDVTGSLELFSGLRSVTYYLTNRLGFFIVKLLVFSTLLKIAFLLFFFWVCQKGTVKFWQRPTPGGFLLQNVQIICDLDHSSKRNLHIRMRCVWFFCMLLVAENSVLLQKPLMKLCAVVSLTCSFMTYQGMRWFFICGV